MPPSSLILPFRIANLARPSKSMPWICRRCLTTQLQTPSTAQATITAVTPSETTLDEIQPGAGPSGKAWVAKWIARKLPHPVPIQYLQHCTSSLLPEQEKKSRETWPPHGTIKGVVVSAGLMAKTVKVRVPGQRWEKRIKKFYPDHADHLVHDPHNSLREGDVVSLHRLRVSSAVNHVVASVISPFGVPLADRPPVPTPEERLAKYKYQRFQKFRRRALRLGAKRGKAGAIQELEAMGLSAGTGTSKGPRTPSSPALALRNKLRA